MITVIWTVTFFFFYFIVVGDIGSIDDVNVDSFDLKDYEDILKTEGISSCFWNIE